MLEQLRPNKSTEQIHSPLAQLFHYIQSLPANPDKSIQGQVQIRIQAETEKSDSLYQESALYNVQLETREGQNVCTFKAANVDGVLKTYVSLADSIDTFVDESGQIYQVRFPGFQVVDSVVEEKPEH